MTKHKLENGLTYYTVSLSELLSIGGAGICDHCGTFHETGYLVPVLNNWICEKCFNEWKQDATHYPEDDVYEQNAIEYYESKIPLNKTATFFETFNGKDYYRDEHGNIYTKVGDDIAFCSNLKQGHLTEDKAEPYFPVYDIDLEKKTDTQ